MIRALLPPDESDHETDHTCWACFECGREITSGTRCTRCVVIEDGAGHEEGDEG